MKSKGKQKKYQAKFNLNDVYYAKMSDAQSTVSKTNSTSNSKGPKNTYNSLNIDRSR